MHPHQTRLPFDQANNNRMLLAERHAIDHRDRSFVGLILGFQDERIVSVPSCGLLNRSHGSDQPTAVLRGSKQGGGTGGRIEAGHA